MNFTYDFSQSALDLRKISIIKDTDSIIVNYIPPKPLLTQLWFGGTGTNDVNGACVDPSGNIVAVKQLPGNLVRCSRISLCPP